MKTVIILAGLAVLALSSDAPANDVQAAFVKLQKKVFDLFNSVNHVYPNDEYYVIGSEYDIEASIDNYSNKKALEEFLRLYKTGFLPKGYKFSPFYDRMRDEAIAVFHLFYYAKDFDTFYKSAAWARVYLNEGQFLYAYYNAVIKRKDTQGFVIPAPYDVYPQFFANLNRTKMQEGVVSADLAAQYGIVKENDH